MFGFVIGSLSLIALFKVAHGYRRGYRCAGGPGGFYGGWHHRGSWRHREHGWHHGGGWRRHALYSLFERLDATPGQEKVITAAMDELRGKLRDIRHRWDDIRKRAAEQFREDVLTEEQTNEVMSPFASQFDELRDATGDAMRKIHEALDPRQRAILADLMERGWGWRHG